MKLMSRCRVYCWCKYVVQDISGKWSSFNLAYLKTQGVRSIQCSKLKGENIWQVKVNFLLRKFFRGNLNEVISLAEIDEVKSISTNEIASFRFPQKISPSWHCNVTFVSIFIFSSSKTVYNHTYCILSNSTTLSNSTASLVIPPDFFAFKIYSSLFNSPALRGWYYAGLT